MIVYNDIMQRLSQIGWTSYRLRKEKILPEGTLTRLRNGDPISTETINTVCRLLKCQPGDILSYVEEEERG